MSVAVVWLKRDLRLQDHPPLQAAVATGHPVLLIYCYEPILLDDPNYSPRHWQFVQQSLDAMQQQLPAQCLWVTNASALDALQTVHHHFGIAALFSHQEVGLANTFSRDKAVQQWCDEQQLAWHQSPLGAVIRGLTHRQQWDKHWNKVMKAPLANIDLATVNWLSIERPESLPSYRYSHHQPQFQPGGEQAAWQTLESFFQHRGKDYAFNLSSPETSREHCSRLSPYLAWGNLSLRQVYQATLAHWHKPGWRRSLVAFSSRLHWHCHFVQKFESESEMEFRSVNRGYEALPRTQGDQADRHLEAWQQGKTGIPMVDACMRCVCKTGYLNFRMRAMLVSFLCHHLGVDWRAGVQHLARQFLDFEPGIHYSQFQMQAGVTGINTLRIYSPVKQGEEKDPDGSFVRAWIPELADVPAPVIHQPWLLSEMEQMMFGVRLGLNYPTPIVDLKKSYADAQALLWSWRAKPEVKQEAKRLLKRHVRPGSRR